MKIFTLLALAMLAACPLFAQKTLTVDNSSTGAAMYTSLQAAIDAAAAGDVILVSGSDNNYLGEGNSTIYLDKSLTIIGAGYNNPYGKETVVGQMHIGTKSAVSGITLKGMEIHAIYISPGAENPVSDVMLEDNALHSLSLGSNYGSMSGFVIRNNTIGSLDIHAYANVTDFLISNNVLHRLYGANATGTANISDIVVQFNVFAASSSYGSYFFGENFIFESNIFWKTDPYMPYIKDNVFSNNIFYESESVRTAIGNNGNTGVNNRVVAADPLKSFDGQGQAWKRLGEFDFHQSANPPLVNASGEQIGVYGGSYKFTTAADIGANPNIPQITTLTIQNVSVPQGGTLNVSFEAKTQQ